MQITGEIWNRSHPGVLQNLSIDSNGDRAGEFSLLHLGPGRHQFTPVQTYRAGSFRVTGSPAF